MRGHGVCPWYQAYFFDNVLRRLIHRPERLLGPYVAEGMRVADVGCGMGFFSIAMARMVGERGRVIAADVQPQILAVLERRARRAGVWDRIEPHLCRAEAFALDGATDFALAFWMVHEVPDVGQFARQLRACLKPGARLFVAEPKVHVRRPTFEAEVSAIEAAGFAIRARPVVCLSRAVVFGLV
jgi:2-polyprenyl-3-methyl-5-hydroxy-6-metoxy-1,4-benzoquinol methylase